MKILHKWMYTHSNFFIQAIGYMQQDLVVAKSLNDIGGECRAHGNMGAAHFSKGNFKEALTSHRYQLVLAMKCKDSHAAASALTSLGHVYTAIGDYQNALASHKQCVDMVKTQLNDKLQVQLYHRLLDSQSMFNFEFHKESEMK